MPLETTKREEKRQRLFMAARKIMGEQGFKNTSLREITQEAGVSRSAFYYYFESKKDLVEKMMDESNERLFEAFNEAVTPGMSTLELFRAISYATYEEIYDQPATTKFIFSEVWYREEEWREVIGEGMNGAISVYADLIGLGQKEGVFDPKINISFASQIVFAMLSTTAAACHDGYIEYEDREDIGEQLVDFLHLGLARREGSV